MTTKEQDEALRALTEKNLIAKFASEVLHCDFAQTDLFVKGLSDRFHYDGVSLQFKSAHGEVPVTDPSCTGFFEREYGFLMPAKTAQDQISGLDAELVAKAKAGNLTARGQLYRTLYKGKGTEAETEKQLATVLAAKSGDSETGDDKSRDDKGRFIAPEKKNSNPFLRANWNLTDQARLVKSDAALAARLAKAAGVQIGSTRPAM